MRETLEFEVEDRDYQNVSSITSARRKPASIIVKEFLLLANTSVAQKIAMHFPDQALLRRHSPPDPRKIVSIFYPNFVFVTYILISMNFVIMPLITWVYNWILQTPVHYSILLNQFKSLSCAN
jgi:hypothetical protein